MQYNLTPYLSVFQHGAKLYKALGWKQSVIVQGSGVAASGLYALGLASLLPVMESLGVGGGSRAFPAFIASIISHSSLLQNHELVSVLLLLATLSVFLLRSAFLGFYYGYGGRMTEQYTRGVRDDILTTYALDREQYGSENAKTKILYLNSQLQQLTSFNWGIMFCTLQAYTLIVLILVNIYLSPGVFAVSIGIGLTMIPLTQPILHRISMIGTVYYGIIHKILTSANNFTEGFETLTTLNVRDRIQKEINGLGGSAMLAQFDLGVRQGFIAALPEILVSIAVLGFFLILGFGAFNGPLIAVSGYSMIRLVGAIGQINERMGDLIKQRAVVDEIELFLQLNRVPGRSHNLARRFTSVAPSTAHMQIRCINITISASNRPLVHNATVSLDGNGIFQLAGPNGSGKSTLLRAIAGLLPYEGSLTIQGREVNTLTRESLASFISYHSQDNFLLEGSFLDNVLLGNPEKNAQDVKHLIVSMQMDRHPLFAKGLDFPIAETASNLSGGERQLICILRTLLRNTPIYLFDEYTNHLSRTVSDLLGVYIKNMKEKLVVVVSHNHMHLADVVIDMEHGQIVKVTQRTSLPTH
ncbi:MAG TPA: ABC transporter ATP-binding protein [Rhizomicrobium sp.]|nr:ABC transporter ATP-binding protein [Rhizomicrobium sp.]